MNIPRLIHQTWKTEQIPDYLHILKKTWLDFHPDWKYILWSDEENRKFVQKYYPEFLFTFDSYPTNIQRADAIRYLILLKYGGLYIDLDFECFENLTALLHNKTCVFAKEPKQHCHMHGKSIIICNAFMASVPGHPFFEHLVKELYNTKILVPNINTYVMETTGPFMVTRVYQRYKKLDVSILNSNLVYPLTRHEVLEYMKTDKIDRNTQIKLNKAVAVHYWFNTWVKNLNDENANTLPAENKK